MRYYRSIWGSIAAIAMFTLVSCKSAVDHNKVITVNFGDVNKKRAVNLSIFTEKGFRNPMKRYIGMIWVCATSRPKVVWIHT